MYSTKTVQLSCFDAINEAIISSLADYLLHQTLKLSNVIVNIKNLRMSGIQKS
jgi:hypothetical protein